VRTTLEHVTTRAAYAAAAATGEASPRREEPVAGSAPGEHREHARAERHVQQEDEVERTVVATSPLHVVRREGKARRPSDVSVRA